MSERKLANYDYANGDEIRERIGEGGGGGGEVTGQNPIVVEDGVVKIKLGDEFSLDSENKLVMPLKTINGNNLNGNGDINISPLPVKIGEVVINTQSGTTDCDLTQDINDFNQIFIKISSNYAKMGSLVLMKPTTGWVDASWYTYQNSLLLIAQNSIYEYFGNFYCIEPQKLRFTEIHSMIANYSTGAVTYSSPVGFTIEVYGI